MLKEKVDVTIEFQHLLHMGEGFWFAGWYFDRAISFAIYDTDVVISYLRHRTLLAPHAPDHPENATTV